jgi:hypothetical protein
MAILQALVSMLGRSASKVLNAIFGWAVIALFGRAPKSQQLLLTGLVAVAAAWPVLLVGVAFPRVAAFLVAFVPLQDRVAPLVLRLVWIGLALLVPLTVGLVVAARAPPGGPREPFIARTLRGFPITLGIACAFLFTFVSVPLLRIVSAVRRRTDEHVPYITTAAQYDETAGAIERIFARNDVDAQRARPPFWLTFPAKVMNKLGGRAMRGFVASELAFWRGPHLEVALQPSDIVVRGEARVNAFVHGVLAEGLARGPGTQASEAAAEELERQLQEVWSVFDENPAAHRGSAVLLARVDDVVKELATLPLDYDQWQVVYRVAAQARAHIAGLGPLIEGAASNEDSAHERHAARAKDRPSVMGTALFAAFHVLRGRRGRRAAV